MKDFLSLLDGKITKENVYEYGIDVFETKEKFEKWLNSKHAIFVNKPIEMLDTEENMRKVFIEIGRIAHGIFI